MRPKVDLFSLTDTMVNSSVACVLALWSCLLLDVVTSGMLCSKSDFGKHID